MYALHALAGFIGVTSGATIIGAFVFGLPSIIAVLMNYARRDAVRGSWLESHFRLAGADLLDRGRARPRAVLHRAGAERVRLDQPRVHRRSPAASAPSAPARASAARWLRMTLGAILAGIWILYRVVRGWLALRDGKAMYG